MTYNVFGGMLSLTQSINQSFHYSTCPILKGHRRNSNSWDGRFLIVAFSVLVNINVHYY